MFPADNYSTDASGVGVKLPQIDTNQEKEKLLLRRTICSYQNRRDNLEPRQQLRCVMNSSSTTGQPLRVQINRLCYTADRLLLFSLTLCDLHDTVQGKGRTPLLLRASKRSHHSKSSISLMSGTISTFSKSLLTSLFRSSSLTHSSVCWALPMGDTTTVGPRSRSSAEARALPASNACKIPCSVKIDESSVPCGEDEDERKNVRDESRGRGRSKAKTVKNICGAGGSGCRLECLPILM